MLVIRLPGLSSQVLLSFCCSFVDNATKSIEYVRPWHILFTEFPSLEYTKFKFHNIPEMVEASLTTEDIISAALQHKD